MASRFLVATGVELEQDHANAANELLPPPAPEPQRAAALVPVVQV
jgi:hypothetical protein